VKIIIEPSFVDCVLTFSTCTSTQPRKAIKAAMAKAARANDLPVILKWGLNNGSIRANCLFVAFGGSRVPFYLDDTDVENWYEILVQVSEGCVAVDYSMRFKMSETPPKRPYVRKSEKPCEDVE